MTTVRLLAVLTLLLAVVVVLKGKVWTGLVGMFINPLLDVGAFRLWCRARGHGVLRLDRHVQNLLARGRCHLAGRTRRCSRRVLGEVRK